MSEDETKKEACVFLKKELNKKERKKALVITLSGDLGSGKTVFVKGLAEGLGIKERVLSPTFVIERRYEVKNEKFSYLIHIDAYRLSSGEDLKVLGWDDKVKDKNNIICLEWPENVSSAIPKETVPVFLGFVSEKERSLRFK